MNKTTTIMLMTLLLLTGVAQAKTTCYWNTTNPTLTEPVTLQIKRTTTWNTYPIWDMQTAQKALRQHKITDNHYDKKLNGTIIKIEKDNNTTTEKYLKDTKLIQQICNLKEYKRIRGRSNNNEATTNEKYTCTIPEKTGNYTRHCILFKIIITWTQICWKTEDEIMTEKTKTITAWQNWAENKYGIQPSYKNTKEYLEKNCKKQ